MEKNIADMLVAFLRKAVDDPRIGPGHISLYASLLVLWHDKYFETPLYAFSHELRPLCKLAGQATFYRCIRQLDQYGYIKYIPSYNHYRGSLLYLS